MNRSLYSLPPLGNKQLKWSATHLLTLMFIRTWCNKQHVAYFHKQKTFTFLVIVALSAKPVYRVYNNSAITFNLFNFHSRVKNREYRQDKITTGYCFAKIPKYRPSEVMHVGWTKLQKPNTISMNQEINVSSQQLLI